MSNNPVSDPRLLRRIQQLISEGHTGAAIELLLQGNYPNADLFKSRFENAAEDFAGHRIKFEEWLRSLTRINHSIMSLWPEEAKPLIGADFKNTIENLLKEEKIMEALQQMMEKGFSDAFLSKGRFVLAQTHFAEKPNQKDWEAIKIQIKSAILYMLEPEEEENSNDFNADEASSSGGLWKSFRKLFE